MGSLILAGWLLIAGSSLGVLWELGLVASGGGVGNRPLNEWPTVAGRMRWTVSIWIVQTLIVFAGCAVLGSSLLLSGGTGFGVVGVAVMGVGVVLLVVEGTLHMSFGLWIASVVSKTGDMPQVAEPFFDWTGRRLQTTFYVLWMAALGFMGVALVNTDVVAGWVGVTTLIWSLGSIGFAALTRRTPTWAMMLPTIPLIGIALLV